ncbi:hypothetical protein ACHHYP_16277, partial [Achlya hypogyna]
MTQSDHSACKTEIMPTPRRRPGLWRTPAWLSKLPAASAIVDEELERFHDRRPINVDVGWRYDENAPRKALEAELVVALRDLQRHPCQAIRDLDIKKRDDTYNAEIQQHKKAAAFKRHITEGARCSKYHLKPPSQHPLHNEVIHGIHDSAGVHQTTQRGMETALHSYYTMLYDATLPPDARSVDQYLNTTVPRTLPPTMASHLAAPILASELYEAIKHAPRGKAPGPNALHHEILQLAPEKWALALELVFAGRLHGKDKLTPSQVQGTTILLHKKEQLVFAGRLHGKDKLTPSQVQGTTILLHKKGNKAVAKNYRPISLVNADVKILTRVLAARLEPCAKHLVHSDQMGFIKGRSIASNIQRLDDLLECVRRYHPSAVVALLDYEKAFDRVDHNFLLAVLGKMGLPPNFVDIV